MRGRLGQCIEDGLEVEYRAADDLEHIGGGGLLCSNLRSSLSRRMFSIAMTAWLAKLLRSAICLAVNGRTSWRKIDDDADQLASLSMGTRTCERAPPNLAPMLGDDIRRGVDDVAHLPCLQHSMEPACRFRQKRPALLLNFNHCGRRANSGRPVEQLSVVAE